VEGVAQVEGVVEETPGEAMVHLPHVQETIAGAAIFLLYRNAIHLSVKFQVIRLLKTGLWP
jgi:hypothetical protein